MLKEQDEKAKEAKEKRDKENAERKEKGLPLLEEEEQAEKDKKKAEKGLKKTAGDKEFMDAGKPPSGLAGKGELGGEVVEKASRKKNKFASA
jgi:hypothetical protein